VRRAFLSRVPVGTLRYQLRGDYSARFGVILAAKAAEIAPCPDFDKEALISALWQAIAGILRAKQAPEGAKSVPTSHKF
jgi:hypothetical protein